MARALVASGANEVHAFSSYPPSLDDTPALLMETHNVVIIELDSDPEFAIDLVGEGGSCWPRDGYGDGLFGEGRL